MSTEAQRAEWRAKSKARYDRDREPFLRRYRKNRDVILARNHARGIPCRGCGTPRAVLPKERARVLAEGGPLCMQCRRDERGKLVALVERLRERRLATQIPREPSTRRRRSGRSGTGAARYRRNRLTVLSASDICGICGHPGAGTADHIVSKKHWTGPPEMFDDVSNLQPAHGSLGATNMVNRCATCGRLCNQSKGARR